MSTDTPTPPGAPATIPARTTPTWEMELLISGATVFGLLQLPALADSLLFHAHNSGPPIVALFVLPLWIYVKTALLTLAATFVVHLCLRGYWVALVGLSSVYPGGVRWDRVAERAGPLSLASMRAKMGDIGDTIERADNRASRVFGIGFALATVMLLPIVLVLALTLLLWLVSLLVGDSAWLTEAGLFVFVLLPIPFALATAWDRRHGAKAAPDSRMARTMRRVLHVYERVGMGRASNPLLVLFSSNEGNRRTVVLMVLTMGLTFMIMFAQAVGDRLGLEFGDYAGLPDDRRAATDAVLPIHYDSQRGDRIQLTPVPTIPDLVVRGPYLRVFIPYFPRRHAEALQIACPQGLAEDTAPRVRLDCLAKLQPLSIDGVVVDVPLDAAEDPRTGQRGVLAMIPVGDLAPGRHELTVPSPSDARDLRDGAKPKEPYRIPFWR